MLLSKKRSDIGPGCSQERDAEDAATLEGKILTAVNKFLTTSPLINKVKLLMVSFSKLTLMAFLFFVLFVNLTYLRKYFSTYIFFFSFRHFTEEEDFAVAIQYLNKKYSFSSILKEKIFCLLIFAILKKIYNSFYYKLFSENIFKNFFNFFFIKHSKKEIFFYFN